MKFFAVVAAVASLMAIGISADDADSGSTGISCGNVNLCSTKRDPVCGSNNVTYRNMCVFEYDDCLSGMKLSSKPGNCPGFHGNGRK
ncbi:hypothetical protein PF008_g15880 [Phytophthora fragariae]|uniref:Kazal-like domain-containing protein n=1 Tax=Phytophthora fragariae TaxID=53985 RepID=A0A6G0RE49_9STRA|nr:hypothetical protein PF008_g15880 [Phytophthora fragariae]